MESALIFLRKLLYLVTCDENIVSSYYNKSQAKDDMITRIDELRPFIK